MSKPFIQLVRDRAELSDDIATQQAFSRMTKWAMLSGAKLISLDEAAWLAAILYKGAKQAGYNACETTDENGARVVSVTMDDGVRMTDGAG